MSVRCHRLNAGDTFLVHSCKNDTPVFIFTMSKEYPRKLLRVCMSSLDTGEILYDNDRNPVVLNLNCCSGSERLLQKYFDSFIRGIKQDNNLRISFEVSQPYLDIFDHPDLFGVPKPKNNVPF